MSNKSPVLGFVVRFVASLGVGGVATLVDLGVLSLLVELASLSPEAANVPGLLAGAVVQFIGCRHIIFRSRGRRLRRQLLAFAGVEAGTLLLNGLLFHALLVITPMPYVMARLAGLMLVFVGFSFPMWHIVFARRSSAQSLSRR